MQTNTDRLRELTRTFAHHVVGLSRALRKMKESILAGQFLRSGTSIGANIAEGRYPQTISDSLSKHGIALKEASETLYWLELFEDMGVIRYKSEFANMHAECNEIIELLQAVISDTRQAKAREARAGKKTARGRKC